MITLLTGKKGSGKTKRLIEATNAAVAASKGNVVVIAKGANLTYDITSQARLINIENYGIAGVEAMTGFVKGICAGNYDVTDIFVDSTLKIIGADADLEALVAKFEALSKNAETNIVLSVSAAEEDIPAAVAQYVAK